MGSSGTMLTGSIKLLKCIEHFLVHRLPIKYSRLSTIRYEKVALATKEKCELVLRMTPTEIQANCATVQEILVVSLQVLAAPMRGGPFWSMVMHDDGENSMK